jgi:hypothetical protein
MITNHEKHTVLVPIVDDDISEATYETAMAFLKRPDSRLVLLHVAGAGRAAHAETVTTPANEPRWHRLACAFPADRTFIDAVAGDPASEIAAEAERFHSDAILL